MCVKTLSALIVVKKCHVVRKMAGFTHGMLNIELDVCEKNVLMLTPAREPHSKDQPGRGRRMEPALAPEKGGDPRSGEDRRNPPSPSGCVTRICNCHWRKSINVTFYYEFRLISAVK